MSIHILILFTSSRLNFCRFKFQCCEIRLAIWSAENCSNLKFTWPHAVYYDRTWISHFTLELSHFEKSKRIKLSDFMDENKLNNQQKFNRWAIKFIALMIASHKWIWGTRKWTNVFLEKVIDEKLKSWNLTIVRGTLREFKKLSKPSRVISWPQSTQYLALECLFIFCGSPHQSL